MWGRVWWALWCTGGWTEARGPAAVGGVCCHGQSFLVGDDREVSTSVGAQDPCTGTGEGGQDGRVGVAVVVAGAH